MKDKSNLKIISILFLSMFILSCEKDIEKSRPLPNEVIEIFRSETGIGAVYVTDTSLLNAVISWQGHSDYPGVDDWATVKIPDNFQLYGGLSGQSEYYTIDQTLMDADTIQCVYWGSLQVKKHPEYGYRPWVGVYEIQDSVVVAISKILANPQYGKGGAWQIYVKNYKELIKVIDTVSLLGNKAFKMTSDEYTYWENEGK